MGGASIIVMYPYFIWISKTGNFLSVSIFAILEQRKPDVNDVILVPVQLTYHVLFELVQLK